MSEMETKLKGEALPCWQQQKPPSDAITRTPRACPSVHGWKSAPAPAPCAVATQVLGAAPSLSSARFGLQGKMEASCTDGQFLSRRKGRYLRRQLKRKENKLARAQEIGGLEDVFTYDKMFKYGLDCCKAVRWKQSVQNFEAHLFSGTARRRRDLLSGKYKWRRFTHFILNERGKRREIDAPHIHDRQVQKTFTKEVLIPLYQPMMIWNNGASMEGKGLAFSRRELVQDLHRHFRKYGLRGHVIVTDCKGFFPNANHAYIQGMHQKIIQNPELCRLADAITRSTGWAKGVPLGVEPSQMEMVCYPSMLDNFMKCQLGLSGAGHYMDDYYMLVPPHLDPKKVLQAFREKAAANCILLSEHKTRILSFGKPFRFCKTKYQVLESGKVLVHGSRETIKRFRRKLKLFAQKIKHHEMSYIDLWASVQSVLDYYAKSNDYGRIKTIKRQFALYFNFPCDKYAAYKEQDKIVEEEAYDLDFRRAEKINFL